MLQSGLFHEQSRPDRDQFVTIFEENILPNIRYNFKKLDNKTIDSRGFAYDYLSIMHYGKTAFSKNNKLITIKPTDTKYLNVIGTATKVSSNAYIVRRPFFYEAGQI